MNPASIRSRIMGNCSLAQLKEPSFRVINTLQDTPNPALQIEALFLTVVLLSESAGLDPHELITRARRQVRDADAVRSPHIEAIRDYAAGELRR